MIAIPNKVSFPKKGTTRDISISLRLLFRLPEFFDRSWSYTTDEKTTSFTLQRSLVLIVKSLYLKTFFCYLLFAFWPSATATSIILHSFFFLSITTISGCLYWKTLCLDGEVQENLAFIIVHESFSFLYVPFCSMQVNTFYTKSTVCSFTDFNVVFGID